MARILIIEDEKKIARFLELELTHEGYEVASAHDGRTGLAMAESYAPDLLILDLILPELSGIEVCRRIRQSSEMPIIMLTAKDDVSDKVMGLDMGADDYVTKPFAIEELLARIRAALKKLASRADHVARRPMLTAGALTLDRDSHAAAFGGTPIGLTKKEFDLLEYLMEHQGKALDRDTLLSAVWGYEFAGDTNIVDVYVRYLRTKLDDQFQVKSIHTLRGVGYLFELRQEETL